MKTKKKKPITANKWLFILCGVLIGSILGTTISLICIKNSGFEKYMDVMPYLLSQRIKNGFCKTMSETTGKTYECKLEKYGISDQDNVVYARFSYIERDISITDRIAHIGEKQFRTVYFWQDESRKNQPDLLWGFSEASGD